MTEKETLEQEHIKALISEWNFQCAEGIETYPRSRMFEICYEDAYKQGKKEATKECNEYYQNELDEVYKNYADRLKDVLKRNEELKTKLAFLDEINNALNNENTELKKDKDYFSENLDKQMDATLNVMKQLNEAKEIIKTCIAIMTLYKKTSHLETIAKAEAFLKE